MLLRRAGVPLNICNVCGLMLAHIKHHTPHLLTVELGDGSLFSCTDLFVQKFLKQRLKLVPCTATQAAQKIPEDTPLQLYWTFFCLIFAC
jgi:hypothetical protein